MFNNKFKTKKVIESVTAGECFKAKREELGITLQELGMKLKIKPEYLEGLENSDFDNLPAEVYLKGFVRSYAEFIGFDPQKMVNMLKREIAVNSRIEKKSSVKKEKRYYADYPLITPKILTIVFSAIILTVVGYYLWHQISSFNSKPYLYIKTPFENVTVENAELDIEGETEKEVAIEINGVNVYVDGEGKFKENVILQPGMNMITVEAKNRFNKATEKKLNVIYKKQIESAPLDYLKQDVKG